MFGLLFLDAPAEVLLLNQNPHGAVMVGSVLSFQIRKLIAAVIACAVLRIDDDLALSSGGGNQLPDLAVGEAGLKHQLLSRHRVFSARADVLQDIYGDHSLVIFGFALRLRASLAFSLPQAEEQAQVLPCLPLPAQPLCPTYSRGREAMRYRYPTS